VEPSRLAVIEQLGLGTASTLAEEQVNCPPGPDINALKSKLLVAGQAKFWKVRRELTELFHSNPLR